MFGLSAEFFSQPYDDKQKYAISEGNRGYSCMNREVYTRPKKGGDPKEAFNFGQFKDDKAVQRLPQTFSTFEQDIADFSKICYSTCHKLPDLLAGALQIDPDEGY
ncbi:hypothetical protein V1525DRAFT_387622 [Lipomyces kononenkoae]|uniref:Uncharacterized protein n=1 Tax=Lipomyces kononenkoae TaxID=34357 RepID=A0ACC3T386_LIPKO